MFREGATPCNAVEFYSITSGVDHIPYNIKSTSHVYHAVIHTLIITSTVIHVK